MNTARPRDRNYKLSIGNRLETGSIVLKAPGARVARATRILAATYRRLFGVPTFAESGVAGYAFSTPSFIFAPRGTSSEIVTRLSGELVRIASAPEFAAFAKTVGFEVAIQSAARLKANAAAELEKWGRLVSLAGMKSK